MVAKRDFGALFSQLGCRQAVNSASPRNNDLGILRPRNFGTLAAYANMFALESFMDELAAAARRDPIAFSGSPT
jgi:CO/xanthine dehydrogenase Mo-binding subunit